ncbi:hypothetical protein AQAU111925_13560 [Aquirufa aurantiipilula]
MVPEPEEFVIVTVAPPAVKLFPLASFAVTTNTCVDPSATILAEVGVKVETAASAAPATTVKALESPVLPLTLPATEPVAVKTTPVSALV